MNVINRRGAMNINPSKLYTRAIAVAFLLVALSLAADYFRFGFRPETMHKVFHVVLGGLVLRFGWNSEAWWRLFPLANGLFFSYVGLFGWLFPDFGGLDAFNRVDTILHSLVGASGLVICLFPRKTPAK